MSINPLALPTILLDGKSVNPQDEIQTEENGAGFTRLQQPQG